MHHRHHEDWGEELREQISSLSREVAHLKKDMTRRGRHTYQGTRHMGEDIVETLREYLDALPDFRRSAHRLQKSAEANPAATAGIAAATVIVIGLAASLFMRRR